MIAFVTQRQVVDEHGETADKGLHLIYDYLVAQGFTPVPVPNNVKAVEGMLETIPCNLLVLTGGGFVPQAYYLEQDERAGSQGKRDAVENLLLNHSRDEAIPVLAICRGMYYLNGWLGGKTSRNATAFKPHEDHAVQLFDGRQLMVNSVHLDAIPAEFVAPGVEVLATEPVAQAVEAFRTRDRRMLALQWHPERPMPDEQGVEFTQSLVDELLA